ncbi:MFS transporter [Cryobacterium sp. TMT1-21]|uniref:MFS transporter n=1 Tax=unclassified Cryobacterium TaxID=2649013 RepID=UPI00106C5839|nr:MULTISPECIES: MFS transporter [unclassified Cryobacterium]TFC83192.1 MFS transporter [Cryobacterium sp. TmT2-59]TFD17959.1 MFS transporter [Cryobacterium sp. TMT4-10]TFD18154.1 MFS transporter [Cryobacterium sp. TMT1-21]TFD24978.1 MFS transporter [Cryobacterium sp. TMT2-23]TFD40051.1 MFS transporter [Cryobacterium sp. TMT2-10]
MSVNQRVEAGSSGRSASEETSGLRKIVAASMVGTVVEWYEFFLYATAASLVFGKFFFPNAGSELDGIIAAFLTYAVGFIARPLGGIVFGQIGDRLGRKHTLQVTIILVGVATFLMGCLPGYNTIGYWAPALLVALRFVQGFAVGGEWGGAVLLVAEHSPDKSRGFWSSWPQAAVPVGNLLATLVLLTMSWILPAEQFMSWGWRVAFWLSAVIVVIGYYIRTHVSEAPIFLEARAQVEAEKAVSYGVMEVVRKYPKGILGAMGLRFAENILYYTIVSFSIVYLVTVHQYDTSKLLLALLIAHIVHFLVIPQVGRMSDRFGRKPVYLAGAILGSTWAFFAFPMFDTQNPVIIVVAITIGLCFHALMYAGQPAIMSEMFPTRMRYSGVSLGYQVTSILAGSMAPIIATALLKEYQSWVPVAFYLVIACAITVVAVVTLKETKGISLREVDAVDARKHGLEPVANGA